MPLESREAIEAAIGHLVEEWAALTYTCMAEAAMVSQTENEPMERAGTAGARGTGEEGA